MFSETEIAYLKTQPLARIATVSKDGQPDVAPVCFDFDGTYFYVGRVMDLAKTLKFKNVQTNPRVALVIDDLESLEPFTPRGIKVCRFRNVYPDQTDGHLERRDRSASLPR